MDTQSEKLQLLDKCQSGIFQPSGSLMRRSKAAVCSHSYNRLWKWLALTLRVPTAQGATQPCLRTFVPYVQTRRVIHVRKANRGGGAAAVWGGPNRQKRWICILGELKVGEAARFAFLSGAKIKSLDSNRLFNRLTLEKALRHGRGAPPTKRRPVPLRRGVGYTIEQQLF